MTLRTAGTCPSSHLLKRIPQRYFPETPDQHYITPPRALSSLQDRESDFEFRFYDPVFTPTSDGQLSDSSSPYSPDEHTSSFGSQLFVFPGAYLSPKMAGSSRDKGRSQPEDYSLDLPFIQSSPIPPGTVWPTSQAGSASAFAFPQPDFTHQGHGLSSSLGMKGWDQGLWDPGSSVKVAETVGLSPNQQYSSFYPTSGEDAAGGRYTPSPETRRRRRTTPEGTKFKCQVCGQLCSRSFNLRMHMQTHDPDRKKPFECPDEGCEAKFSRRADLDRHLKTEVSFEMFFT
ncbi:MAG: hypothetical protein M1834_004206 [Cirrosporium novae-zelandiae]|nr:MAG: hypothetical protein M1834_004206 [Cirrosporium novae-zelandiae]